MKKFISILALIILVIVATGAFLGYKLISAANTYFTSDTTRSEKVVAWLWEWRSILRTQVENQTGTMSDILYKTYDILTTQTQNIIAKTEQTQYIVDIQTNDMIISYSVQIPRLLESKIQYTSPALWVTNLEMETTNGSEMIAGMIAMTSGDRQTQEKEWLLNIEKITTSGDIVVAYTRALGVAATGIELEIFADLTEIVGKAITSGSITKIEKIEYTIAYIKDITSTTGSISITVDPIERFDGTGANEAFAKYDPTACAASISWTTSTTCTPPNAYFIYNADTGTLLVLEQKEGKLELIDTSSPEGETIIWDWDNFTKEFTNKYANIPFHIYYNAENKVLQITEQYVP